MRLVALVAWVVAPAALLLAQPGPADPNEYVRRGTRAETVLATLAAHGLPTLEGTWYYAGPFDATGPGGVTTAFPPERGVDLTATYPGKGGAKVGWKPVPDFRPGQVFDLLRLFPDDNTDAVAYLYHEFHSRAAFRLPLSLGSDDSLTVFADGKKVLHEDHVRGAAPDQSRAEVDVKPGVNTLLLKVGQYAGGWGVYVHPDLPADAVPVAVRKRLDRDFPPRAEVQAAATAAAAEARAYPVTTLPPPADCVLEVGGLGFRPDGKLLACTRRGEVWLVHNPGGPPEQVKFTRFAAGLHEPLGLHVADTNTVYVVQRPELTKLVDRDGDGTADEYGTVCDRWGVSGDYHEFAFGPAVDKQGNFFVSLNVGFGGGHQSKAAWRGWCVKIDPKTGRLEPWAYGLRSPNTIAAAPDGELFYADNQGEWVASNKLHHVRRGAFFGHQAPLRWVPDSPFAGQVPDKVASGMTYDGQNYPALSKHVGRPPHDPPAVWFPYGRMGQSVSEPAWDATGGRFGPFAGQCFVGDQTRASVMRVALEKVNGVYQGACFPFRSGLQCGVNRLCFGPDGALYAGQTSRGWGSTGGKPYGLQRIAFAGDAPFEVHSVSLTKDGFDLRFTKPLDPATATADAFPVKSFTYVYWPTYGSPEVDQRAEKVTKVGVSADGRTVSLAVPGLTPGRVYEVRLPGVRSAAGDPVLHPEAYYTLNELVK